MCECGAARLLRAGLSSGATATGPAATPRRMPTELALRVLDEARALGAREVIPSTMGEPLLWSGLDALLDRASQLGLSVNVTTNGTFPGRGAAGWAARLLPLASDVKISWNGATAATAEAIMPGLDFRAAVENVRALTARRDALAREGGPRAGITFQVTAQEENVGELAGIVRLASDLGVDRVKLNHLQPRLPGLAGRSLRRSAEAIARWNAAVGAAREEAERLCAAGRPIILQNAVALAPDPAAPAPRAPCPFVGREAWVHADGTFAPCPHPEAVRGGLGEFGSLADRPLAELWTAPAFTTFVARWEEHPVCGECPLRRPGGA